MAKFDFNGKMLHVNTMLMSIVGHILLRIKDGTQDAVIICEGEEGFGKTNIAVILAYIIAKLSGRSFPRDASHMFFDLEKLVVFLQKTRGQVVVWDEAALGGLSSEWFKRGQRLLTKLLMVIRKRGHVIIMNIPRFNKLSEYLILDRSIGMVHVYSRDGREKGRYAYFNNLAKEKLYNDWKKSRVRNYPKFATFYGWSPYIMPHIIDEEKYDKLKEEGIMGIGDDDKERMNQTMKKVVRLQYACYLLGLKYKGLNQDLAGLMDMERSSISFWRLWKDKYADLVGNMTL